MCFHLQANAASEQTAAVAKMEAEEAKQQLAELQAAPSGEATESAIARLIQLVYFALVRPSCDECLPMAISYPLVLRLLSA